MLKLNQAEVQPEHIFPVRRWIQEFMMPSFLMVVGHALDVLLKLFRSRFWGSGANCFLRLRFTSSSLSAGGQDCVPAGIVR